MNTKKINNDVNNFIKENYPTNIINNYNILNSVKLKNNRVKFPYNILHTPDIVLTYKNINLKYSNKSNILKQNQLNNPKIKGGTDFNIKIFCFE